MVEEKAAIEKRLWDIANTLRGKMSADDSRDHILGFIFYKYLSDKMLRFANEALEPDKLVYADLKESGTGSGKDKQYLDAIKDDFERFWNDKKIHALKSICDDEHLDQRQFQSLIDAYLFNDRDPLDSEVLACLDERPSILHAHAICQRIVSKMKEFVDVFLHGMVI